MRLFILGSGVVGQVLATKFVQLGHEVWIGTRDPEATRIRTTPNPQSGISFATWHARNPEVRLCPFKEGPKDPDFVFNATAGTISLEVLETVGEKELSGKVLIDLANPLDFSKGMPPTLTVCNTDSLGEQIQRRFPETHVIKALNTVNCQVMVSPGLVPGEHELFICGNEDSAKKKTIDLLGQMGWPEKRILDLGGIQASRGTEMLMPFWMSLVGALGTPLINYKMERP